MTTQRHPGADLSHDGAERVQGEGREGFVASTGVFEPTGYYPYQQERDDLQRWKDEALPVIAGLQELGKALGLPLGSRITGPEAAGAATDLAARLAEAEAKVARVEALTYAGDDGSEWEHRGDCHGEPECPACWSRDIRRALDGTR